MDHRRVVSNMPAYIFIITPDGLHACSRLDAGVHCDYYSAAPPAVLWDYGRLQACSHDDAGVHLLSYWMDCKHVVSEMQACLFIINLVNYRRVVL